MRIKIQSKNGHKVIHSNRRKAIRERCLNCTAWSAREVRNCKHADCQLFQYRTGKGKQSAIDRAKAIREYCLWCCNDQMFEVSRCPNLDCPLFPYRKAKVDHRANLIANIKKRAYTRLPAI